MATVSIFGLGYVGSVVAACLAEAGHKAIGIDANPAKIALIADGRSPVVENGLEELVRRGVKNGRIRATKDAAQAVLDSSISMICVGTPSDHSGGPDLSYVVRVSEEMGDALRSKEEYHVIAVRSTVLPGTTEEVVIPLLERRSGKKAKRDFGICFNPEFLREGSSIEDFYDPPYTVIGSDDERAASALAELYSMLAAPVVVVPFKVAEMLKYANNAFHALKVCFANEIGNLCRKQNIDSHQVMNIVCMDKKLNLSSYYLKPGFAFGGSCLPKDLRGLLHRSRHLDLPSPLLEAILPSNSQQVEIACQMIERMGRRRVGICGFSFKAGTDDLRESPVVKLIEFLIGKGYPLKVYDENVSLGSVVGANRAYIQQTVPHIGCLMADSLDAVMEWSDVIIIGTHSHRVESALVKLNPNQAVLDLVRIRPAACMNGNYQGICW